MNTTGIVNFTTTSDDTIRDTMRSHLGTTGNGHALIGIAIDDARYLAGYLSAIIDYTFDSGDIITRELAELQHILNSCSPLRHT